MSTLTNLFHFLFVLDSVDCNFDQDYCHWTNAWSTSPSFKWYRHRGPTPSRNTGPNGDHGGKNGVFLFTLVFLLHNPKTVFSVYAHKYSF